jgi:pimeloyl-ACP methyl ester carboxylesterase
MPDASQSKSTTVRLNPLPIPGWVRAGMRMTSVVSPHVAARLAERIFFSPSRLRLRPDDAAVLQRAERFSVTVRGAAVRGFSWGRGPTVILSHGWSGHAGQMTAFVEPLLAADFRVVALDMPGHGTSGGSRSSLVHFSETLLQTSALFGPVHGLVAHSFGAASAVYALSRGLAVERAVFVAPTARFEPFWDRFRDGLGIPEGVLREALGHAEEWLETRLADMMPLDLAARLETPLLVLHDVEDREVAFEEAQALTSSWKGSVLRESRGLGHHRILRDPGVGVAAISFLQRSPREPGSWGRPAALG